MRLQLAIRPYEEMSGVPIPDDIVALNQELSAQLSTSAKLGVGAITIAEGCLKIISDQIEKMGK